MRRTVFVALLVLAASAALFFTLRDDSEAAWPGLEGRIAFHNTGVNPGIYSVNANGSDLQQLTTGSDFHPSWSPNGQKIVFQRGVEVPSIPTAIAPQGCGSVHLWTMDANGENEVQVGCGYNASWSSDGTKILFVNSGDVRTMDANGANEQVLVSLPNNQYFPVMSPNGTKIAYTEEVPPLPVAAATAQPQGPGSPTYELWMMDANGSNQVLLDDLGNNWSSPFPSDWAPDSSRLVYHYAGSIVTVTTGGVITSNFIDASAPEPAWSPDGGPIVFSRYAPSLQQCPPDAIDYVIAVIPEGGHNSTDVVGDVGSCEDEYRHPDWQPTTSQATPTASPTASPTATPSPGTPTATATASPTATATPSETCLIAQENCETATPTFTGTLGPTPTMKDVVWGDDQCDEESNPVDSLFTLRFDAGLSTNTGDCPPMNHDITIVEVLPAGLGGESPEGKWGNVDCDAETNPIDSLKILRYDAGFDSGQDEPCPLIGADVRISYFP